MPRGTVEPRFVRRMNIFLRTASPLLATGSQLNFDHALRPECQSHCSIEVLFRRRNENALASRQWRWYFRLMHDLRKVRRTDFFFAFSHKREIHRQFFSRGANCMQRRKKSRLWSFLIHRTAADNHFSEIWLIYQRGVSW